MRSYLLMAILIIGSVSCASKKVTKEVNSEITSAPPVKTESELYRQEQELIDQNKNLTVEQKNKLGLLIQKAKIQNQEFDQEISKTKAVLFKELMNEKSGRAKINVLEAQLLKLNRKKTRYSLGTYREAKSIVGKSDVPLEKTLQMIDNRTLHEF
ncbi:MAG: hypothetical protein ACXVLQ_16260 [Bacteriovorax sp.]